MGVSVLCFDIKTNSCIRTTIFVVGIPEVSTISNPMRIIPCENSYKLLEKGKTITYLQPIYALRIIRMYKIYGFTIFQN